MKCYIALLLLLCMVLAAMPALADSEYIGNMEVVNCSEWVSLREEPSTRSERLVKVSLGAIVSNCQQVNDAWIYAEYDGYSGYILAKYLQPSEGRLTFSAMMVTILDGAPFYATIDSTEPIDCIPANTIVRNCHVDETIYLLWFKLRNDTAQHYEFIRIENITCDSARSFINLNLFGDQSDNSLSSKVNDVTVKDCSCSCDVFYDVTVTEGRTSAQNFTLENLQIKCRESRFDKDLVRNTVAKNIVVNGEIQ